VSTKELAYIETPSPAGKPVKSLVDVIGVSGDWHAKTARKNRGMLSDLWYRGVSNHYTNQIPGVYREKFSARAQHLEPGGKDMEKKRLYLERYLVSQFRSAGAPFLEGYSTTQIYFAAEHYGLPTRLLDWSTNPLAALFFACEDDSAEDGFVYAMDAGKSFPATQKCAKV
jgi:hypothetical protein